MWPHCSGVLEIICACDGGMHSACRGRGGILQPSSYPTFSFYFQKSNFVRPQYEVLTPRPLWPKGWDWTCRTDAADIVFIMDQQALRGDTHDYKAEILDCRLWNLFNMPRGNSLQSV